MPSSILGATPTTLPASTGSGPLDAYTQASLTALGNGVDYTQSPTYQSLQALLAPGANGGLNSSLIGQYNAAQPLINQQVQQNAALAESTAQGNGLGGSSIQAQGVENAEAQGTAEDAQLLSALYGEQNANTGALASDLASGSNTTMQDLLGIYSDAGTSAANLSMYSAGLQEALQAASQAANAQQNAGIAQGAGSALGGLAMYAALA
jgi:hypothetical protein